MTDIYRLYVARLAREMKDRAELCNRETVDLRDAAAALETAAAGASPGGNVLGGLADFAAQFNFSCLDNSPVPQFPAPTPLRLNFLKPGSQEVLHRKMHIYDYLPAMHPELEELEFPPQPQSPPEHQKADVEIKAEASDGETAATPGSATAISSSAAISGIDESAAGGRQPSDHMPVREISSVMMTLAGFISPAREGKLPESRGPMSMPPREEIKARTDLMKAEQETAAKAQTSAAAQSKPPETSSASGGGTTTVRSPAKKTKNKKKLTVFQRKPPKEPVTPALVPPSPPTPASDDEEKGRLPPVALPPQPAPDHTEDIINSVIERGVIEAAAVDSKGAKKKKRKEESPAVVPPVVPASKEPPLRLPNPEELIKPTPHFSSEPTLIPKQLYGFGATGDDQKSDRDDENPKKKKSKSSSSSSKSKEKLMKKKRSKKDKEKSEQKAEKKKKPKDSKSNVKLKIKDSSIDKPTKTPTKVVFKNIDSKKQQQHIPHEFSTERLFEPVRIERPPPLMLPPPQAVPPPTLAASASQKTLPTPTSLPLHPPAAPEPPKKIKRGRPESKDKSTKKRRQRSGNSDTNAASVAATAAAAAAATATAAAAVPAVSSAAAPAAASAPASAPAAAPATSATPSNYEGEGFIVAQTVGHYVDDDGNQIWICPACGKQDDGSPMIGCDNTNECDDWYHWHCVGIQQAPEESQKWFCQRCVAKKQGAAASARKTQKKVKIKTK